MVLIESCILMGTIKQNQCCHPIVSVSKAEVSDGSQTADNNILGFNK